MNDFETLVTYLAGFGIGSAASGSPETFVKELRDKLTVFKKQSRQKALQDVYATANNYAISDTKNPDGLILDRHYQAAFNYHFEREGLVG